jgi:YggT family protein
MSVMSILWLTLKTVVGLFVAACLMRSYLQVVRLHAQNPLSRLTFQMTDWIVLRFRRLVPGFGGFDWASFLSALVLSCLLAVVFYFLMSSHLLPATQGLEKPVRPFGWLVALAVLWMTTWGLQLAVVILIASVLLAWLNPMHPLKPVFDLLVAPMLAPFRRLLGRGQQARQSTGFDFSPIGAFLVLQILGAVVAEMEMAVMRHLF